MTFPDPSFLAYPSRLWPNIPPEARMSIAHEVGHRFSILKQDTQEISERLGFPESTIYSALHCWREKQFGQRVGALR